MNGRKRLIGIKCGKKEEEEEGEKKNKSNYWKDIINEIFKEQIPENCSFGNWPSQLNDRS